MSVWFDSWQSLLKIFVSSVVGYLVLVAYVRLLGKRATSKMNNFDWIVTVAVGSVFASMVVLKNVPVLDGIFAMGTLLGLQFLLTLATSRWNWARRLFLATPSVLFLRGEFLDDELRKERVSREEVLSAIRESGLGCVRDVDAVTLEPDSEMSVVHDAKGTRLDVVDIILKKQ